MSDNSSQTQKLLDQYFRTRERKTLAEIDLGNKITDFENAEQELGNHITPKDAKLGETFSIWVRVPDGSGGSIEKLLCVSVLGNLIKEGNPLFYKIEWRS